MNEKQMMNDRNDQISGYLDGVLSAPEMLAFEAEMELDPALAEAVARWQSNDSMLQHAFDAPMQENVSNEMLARFGLAETPAASNIVDFKSAQIARREQSRVHNFVTPWRWPLAGALAAGLVAVVMIGTQLLNDAPFDIKTSKSFQVAMQDAPSAVRSKVENGQEVSPTLSFIDGDGRYCREFALAGPGAQENGIACMTSEKWQIEAIAKGPNPVATGSEIRTAGGAEGASLDRAYARLKASDPLGADKEKSLIANGWKK